MNAFSEFQRIIYYLQRENVRYALIGGVAMSFYSEPRYTKDIDFLVAAEDLEKVGIGLAVAGYIQRTEPWTFASSNITLHRFSKFEGEHHLFVDVMIGHDERHALIIDRALETPSEEGRIIRVAQAEDLIWMKRLRNSQQDQVDIHKLQNEQN